MLDQATAQPGGVGVVTREPFIDLFFGIPDAGLEGDEHMPQEHQIFLLLPWKRPDRAVLIDKDAKHLAVEGAEINVPGKVSEAALTEERLNLFVQHLRAERVDAVVALCPRLDEPDASKLAQVMRDGRVGLPTPKSAASCSTVWGCCASNPTIM